MTQPGLDIITCLKYSEVVFTRLINVKMVTIIGMFLIMSRRNLMLSWVGHEKFNKQEQCHHLKVTYILSYF